MRAFACVCVLLKLTLFIGEERSMSVIERLYSVRYKYPLITQAEFTHEEITEIYLFLKIVSKLT